MLSSWKKKIRPQKGDTWMNRKVPSVATITRDHAIKDIDDAKAFGVSFTIPLAGVRLTSSRIDGFALNVFDPTHQYVVTTLSYLFDHAQNVGFELFISMDLCAYGVVCADAGRACDGPNGYTPLLLCYINSPAYSKVNGKPLISTYSSGGQTHDQIAAWKATVGPMYFVPDFDETQGYYEAADGWWTYWGDVVDGLFSWEAAWPKFGGFGGNFPGDISPDVTVMNGARAHRKSYMIGVSPLQYKNAYGTNVYRPGGTSLPQRLASILALPNPPELVQVISWNDGPESHYIGNVWPEANPQVATTPYSVYDHTGWQHLIQFFIQSYKGVGPGTANAPGVMWYQTTLQSSICPHDTKPANFADGDDFVHWATFLPPSVGTCQVKIVTAFTVLGTHSVGPGASFGNTTLPTAAGVPTMEIIDSSGNVLAVASGGKPVSNGHPEGIYDMNYQVVAAKAVEN